MRFNIRYRHKKCLFYHRGCHVFFGFHIFDQMRLTSPGVYGIIPCKIATLSSSLAQDTGFSSRQHGFESR